MGASPVPSTRVAASPAAGEAAGAEIGIVKRRAPTLYAIIAIKLIKGLSFVILATTMYTLSDNDLPYEYQNLLHHLRLNPERRFWSDLAIQVGNLTEKRVVLAAAGTLVYSLFSLVEAIGLMFRIRWIGWMTIGESAFFIPIEIYELTKPHEPGRSGHPLVLLVILGINVLIVWYLYQNRNRLFRHHHHED
ncbi:MAG TPA: DUF2127 domain-containing protein [Candidatus Dormibacteraeota bacterium]|nr:DUF2127 domain-containing protein [Candidatus Dormibacteraeota bacterium]